MQSYDSTYLEIFTHSIGACLAYLPKFGKGNEGLNLEAFQEMYANDPLYQWFGLGSPRIYAAHRAAGGITSIYRQIGIACQALFRRILQDQLSLLPEQITWSYEVSTTSGKRRQLALDARINLSDVQDEQKKQRIRGWLDKAASVVELHDSAIQRVNGIVFEIRQGYKSKDSKRQNADLEHAIRAYSEGYLPVIMLFSQQIDRDVARRYQENFWLLLQGELEGEDTKSTYVFCRDIIGYDVAAFFQRNAESIRKEVENVLNQLLS